MRMSLEPTAPRTVSLWSRLPWWILLAKIVLDRTHFRRTVDGLLIGYGRMTAMCALKRDSSICYL